MQVLVAAHESSLSHDTGPRHPERADRVRAILSGIRSSGLDIDERTSPLLAKSDLTVVHDPAYIEMIEKYCSLGGGALDMDTVASPATWEAALASAGGVQMLVEELETMPDATGFSVSRPPGHHALADRAMGFCIFNNVAIAAARLSAAGKRVAILDWDVHHGNGTQALLADDPSILYISLHQADFYPFEGLPDDIDAGEAPGTLVNIPLPGGTAGDIYREAWRRLVIPVLTQFGPDWVFVSSGFDAHELDPLADLSLQASDYGWMAAAVAEVVPTNRIVTVLEGGYNLNALSGSVSETLLGFAGLTTDEEPDAQSPVSARPALDEATSAVQRHWSVD